MSTPPSDPPTFVAAAVTAVPGVARMSAGPTEQFRSYLPGGATVHGVRFDDDVLLINVVALWGVSLDDLGARIREAVTAWSGTREVVVAVDDLDVPDLDVPRLYVPDLDVPDEAVP